MTTAPVLAQNPRTLQIERRSYKNRSGSAKEPMQNRFEERPQMLLTNAVAMVGHHQRPAISALQVGKNSGGIWPMEVHKIAVGLADSGTHPATQGCGRESRQSPQARDLNTIDRFVSTGFVTGHQYAHIKRAALSLAQCLKMRFHPAPVGRIEFTYVEDA